MANKKILIIDDDANIRKLAEIVLKSEGFDILTAPGGGEGLEKIAEQQPDLVLLDIDMPEMNGFEVCKKIRENMVSKHLPVIMLTASVEESSITKALGIGSDDYVIKPFSKAELVARIRRIIERTDNVLDANPLTKLPGNIAISCEIEKRIRENKLFSVLYLDIDRFKSFNDKYGFARGDGAIRLTARILIDAINNAGESGDFIGHIGGDDFLVVTVPERAVGICNTIIENFDREARLLYDENDRELGYIVCRDRIGRENKFSVMSISIAVVTNEKRKITHPGEVSAIGAELKKYAKSFEGSKYKIDRRRE